MNNIDMHKQICSELTDMYEAKNSDYGNAFAVLRDEYPEAICYRLTDKLCRLKTLYSKHSKGYEPLVNESIEDTLKDIANYAIMELIERMFEEDHDRHE